MKKLKKTKKEQRKNVLVIVQKFLSTYEHHCTQTSSAVSSVFVRNLQKCIARQEILTKLIFARLETTADSSRPVTLKPLLMTIRDERYMYGKELCVWHVPLNNEDIANLAIILELRGRTSYPFSKIELLDCGIDTWSIERLGKSLKFSALTCIVLDYNKFRDEGLRGLCQGLKGNGQLLTLSMCYCNLGPSSGSFLGNLVPNTAIRDLFLDGNDLQCEGAGELIKFIAEHAEQMTEKQSEASLDIQRETSEAFLEGRKKKEIPQIGPWLSKLHLADNGIDGRGNEGKIGAMKFTEMLCQLIKLSHHLTELHLDGNCLGELCGKQILDALRERKEEKEVIN
ncbi:ribonuclease inhibitor isoform X2 [Narcine bancroftii]|uniref:ribonuclease inhibitor isoform X2 n=1 Tax=Narcine bancroftii TaxID=1343680 RepID=UPI00383117BE